MIKNTIIELYKNRNYFTIKMLLFSNIYEYTS